MTARSQRPTFHAELGEFLIHLRRTKGWSQRQATTIARQRGLALSLGPLRFLEEGKTKHPDRPLLTAIAALYDIPFELLVQRFVAANYGVDVKVTTTSSAATSVTVATDPTLARVMALEARVAQYQSTFSEMRDIVERAADASPLSERKNSS